MTLGQSYVAARSVAPEEARSHLPGFVLQHFTIADRSMILFRHPASLLHRTEPLRTALIAAAFWTLAVIALTNLRYVHLGGLPQVEGIVARVTMACCVLLLGIVGARCVMAWRKSGSLAPVRRTLGGTPGMLLFGAVASYLAIGASVSGVEAIREPDTAGFLKYHVLHLGVLAAAAVGGRAVLEGTGAERLLRGVLVLLIVSCAVILASPVLRDLGILPPYKIPFRLTGAFDPNEAGLTACMTAALAAALLTNGGPRALGWLGLAAGGAASMATASRTALALLGAVAVVFLLINVRSKPRSFVLAWAATGLVGIAGFAGVVGFSGGFSEWSRLRSAPDFVHEGSLFCDPSPPGNPGADCAVLLATRDLLAGDMALNLNWNKAVSVNSWQGVTVGPEGRVTGLDLAGLGLNGRIPSDLGRLDRLVSLSLQRNRLSGRIPPELGDLASLERLNLSYNALIGGIPPELAKLENLEELWLKYNRLTGPVPAALGELHPSVLRLSGNDFDAVPPEPTAGAAHDPADTRLCTPPPTSPARFDDCAVLLAVKDSLDGNASLNWRAAVPVGLWQGVTIGREGHVVALDLRDMNLTGRLPAELGELSHLHVLRLDGNRLTGPIPPELGNLTRLTMLSLDGNRLTGPIPPALANLSNLGQLWLANNRLTGSIPPELAGIERLSLAVAGNDFHGCLPWVLDRLSRHDIKDTLICTFLGNARLRIWRLGFEKAMEAPVFGHGYRALVFMDGAPIGHAGNPVSPHNQYLLLLGEAGIVPLLLFVSALVLLLRAQWGAPKSLARDATVAWVIVIALYGVTQPFALTFSAYMFLAGLSVATGTARNDGDRHVAKA